MLASSSELSRFIVTITFQSTYVCLWSIYGVLFYYVFMVSNSYVPYVNPYSHLHKFLNFFMS